MKITDNGFEIDNKRIWFSNFKKPDSDEWFVTAILLYCMQRNRPIIVDRLSRDFLQNIVLYQKIINHFWPQYRIVPIKSEKYDAPLEYDNRILTPCTLGVDSLHEIIANKPDAVINISGLDVPLKQSKLVREKIRRLGLNLIEIDSNIRSLGSNYEHAHMQYIVSIALMQNHGRFVVPGSYGAYTLPWGSSCILDPLLSTGFVDILHGASVNRLEKLRIIYDEWQEAFDSLVVCWQKREDYSKNCGTCSKCNILKLMCNLLEVSYPKTMKGDLNINAISTIRTDKLFLKRFLNHKMVKEQIKNSIRSLLRR